MKRNLIISCILVLSFVCFGCAKKGENLPISETARASAAGIINGISSMDGEYTEELLAMDAGEIEDFFKNYGYSVDGSAFLSGVNGYMDAVEEMGGVPIPNPQSPIPI